MALRTIRSFLPALHELEPRVVPTASPASADPVAPGQPPVVTVRDAAGAVITTITAYESTMTVGVRVAVADVTGDGVRDIVTAPGQGGGPRVRVFDGAGFASVADYFAYDSAFYGGVHIAAGKLNHNTLGVVTGAGAGGAPHVRMFTPTGAMMSEFFAGAQSVRTGVKVELTPGPGGRAAVTTTVDRAAPETYNPWTGQRLSKNSTVVGDFDLNGDGTVDGATLDRDGDGEPDPVDVNGDGEPDGVAVDLDGDGEADGVGFDFNGDGYLDAIVLDRDHDGKPDGFDLDGDGEPEWELPEEHGLLVDLNGDGFPDGFALDLNGDGEPDAAELDLDGDGQPDLIDWDGDGQPDGIAIDLNGDGQPDAVGYDVNGDGVTDGIGLDADGDGTIDGVDTDGDGEPDAVGLDIDGDGVVDGFGIDTNGDGEPDEVDIDGDGEPDGLAVDFDGDGEPDALGLDTDGNGSTDGYNPNVYTDTTPIGAGNGGQNDPDPAPGPTWNLSQEVIDDLLNELLKKGRDDVAYWLSFKTIKIRKYETASSDYVFTDPPWVKATRVNGNLKQLEFWANLTVAQWATGLIEFCDSGTLGEYWDYYNEVFVPDPLDWPTGSAGSRIPQHARDWLQSVLANGPAIMAGAAFTLALDVLPMGGAGRVLAGIANQGFRLVKLGAGAGTKVIAKGGVAISDALLGRAVKVATNLVPEAEAAEWIGRFCFSPDTVVHTEHGLRPIRDVNSGDCVWSFRFATGDWTLCTVADARISTYHGTMTSLRTAGGDFVSTGDHPYWVVRGLNLAARPRCQSLKTAEDEGISLDGRWVAARDVLPGDVMYGRDGGQHEILTAESCETLSEVCNLSIHGHANFAVGVDGVLVHNDPCFRDIIRNVTGVNFTPALQAVAQAAQTAAGRARGIHGHHIVMKMLNPLNYSRLTQQARLNLLDSQRFMGRWQLSMLRTEAEAQAAFAAKGRLHNLCYAVNHFEDIHQDAYVNATHRILVSAQNDAVAELSQNVSPAAFNLFWQRLVQNGTVNQALAAMTPAHGLNGTPLVQLRAMMNAHVDNAFTTMRTEMEAGRRYW